MSTPDFSSAPEPERYMIGAYMFSMKALVGFQEKKKPLSSEDQTIYNNVLECHKHVEKLGKDKVTVNKRPKSEK